MSTSSPGGRLLGGLFGRPAHTSEARVYVPIGYMDSGVICSNAAFMIPDATPFHFGVLSSIMHMAWVRAVCGRLESRYRYSAGIVFNNFPWPNPSVKQRAAIEAGSALVLQAREAHPYASLADLYDPLAMPEALVKAHQVLDRAVDATYGKTAWKSEAERVVFHFGLYEAAVSIFPATKVARKRATRLIS